MLATPGRESQHSSKSGARNLSTSGMARKSNAEIAQDLARAGIEVFPCREADSTRLNPKTGKPKFKAKAPYIAKGLRAASACLETVRKWWTRWPLALIGIVPGQRAVDALVIDLDRKHGKDGVTAFRGLVSDWRDLPFSETPSGGEHIWFARPESGAGNDMGDLPAGIDIRCDNGYICVGELADGSRYAADDILDDIVQRREWPPLPASITDLLKAARPAPAKNADKAPADYLHKGAMLCKPEAVTLNWAGYDSKDASSVFASLFETALDAVLAATSSTISDHEPADLCLTVHKAIEGFLEAEHGPDADLAADHLRRRGGYSIVRLLAKRTAEDPHRGPETVKLKRVSDTLSTGLAKITEAEIATDTHAFVRSQLRELAESDLEKSDPLEFHRLFETIGNKATNAGLKVFDKLPGQRKTLLAKTYEAERDAVVKERAKEHADKTMAKGGLEWPHVDGHEFLPRKDSLSNARAWLEHYNTDIRYNEWTDEIELDKRRVTDASAGALRVSMHDDQFFASDALVSSALRHVATERGHHPVKRYLERQEKGWDGVERLDNWLIDYCGAEDNEHWRIIGRLVFIAIVMRIYHPGAKFDMILTLLGPEGTGKSSLCRILAIKDDWHLEGFQLGWSAKQILENCTGKLICEYGELAGHTQKEQGALKDAVTRQKDKERKAYDRHATERKRQFIIIANSNELEVLVSRHGNRRFIPLTIGSHIDLEGLESVIDQLYGEAMHAQAEHLEQYGEAVLLPRAHWDYFGLRQEEHRYRSAVEDKVAALMDGFSAGYVRVVDLYDALDLRHNNPGGAKDAEHAMTAMGWRKIRARLGEDANPQRYFTLGEDYRDRRLRPVTQDGVCVGLTDQEPTK